MFGASPVGAHLLVKAPTGSGKSASVCVAALMCVDERIAGPHVVIVTPSRPLSSQIFSVITQLGARMPIEGRAGVSVAKLYGVSRCCCVGLWVMILFDWYGGVDETTTSKFM